MLLLVEQQHQKLLIHNYSRESREGYKARGDDAFQEDIRFGQQKNISTQAHSVCFQHSVSRILGSITRVCAIQILSIVFLQIQYISRSPIVTCN